MGHMDIPNPDGIAGVDEVNAMVPKALVALDKFRELNQEQIDYIVKKASVAALNQHAPLAKIAVEETGRGRIEDKAVKNIFACEHVTNYLAKQKTVGIISRDPISGVIEVADPVGVVAGITPTTNPTSTAIFKSLIALKTRNPIIFAFHPSAQKCSAEAARVVRDAAVKAGAPEDCIQWIDSPSMEGTAALMNHDIVVSKNFDYGMICASEQAAIVDNEIWDEFMREAQKLHAYICNAEEKAKLELYIFGVNACQDNCAGNRKLNPDVVGMSPEKIAENAGFSVPEGTSVLFAEIPEVGLNEPLSFEKLSDNPLELQRRWLRKGALNARKRRFRSLRLYPR